ncbi:hypothetical protein Asp14428_79320 [Actinoplanes sp. NBRC 14428]|uniref:Uncharacterized protein n=1 Tax=Pseudosporangium ferrugineum TaxID=439699 RepID=A0A2T0SJL0_9ACTN|nr:hypothetical protein [Pseudosporangium ferrugineum]PRY33592.1 hypothetical protein CLV70_101755 [Pseudosporangium ferrugineum]BCJ56457.1 hypothetical protein Asp14428_79320 [Actinoplanes sp. NBRC 14428]
MTSASHEPGQDPPADKPGRSVEDFLRARAERRRERIRGQLARDRQGDHLVPTWVMAVAVAAMVLGWLYLVISS